MVIRLMSWATASALIAAVVWPVDLAPSLRFEDMLFRVALGLVVGLMLGVAYETVANRYWRPRAR